MTTPPDSQGETLVILMPVYNDWGPLQLLLRQLDEVLASNQLRAHVVLIDDGSSLSLPSNLHQESRRALLTVDVVALRRNLGHQRAIAIGLAHVHATLDPQVTIVMDSDGEDDPHDLPRLLQKLKACGGEKIIFAERTKRSEPLLFRVFYGLYRLVHRLLTGQRVRVGNFSAVPATRLASLVAVSEIWNHYAAAAHKSRQPLDMIPTQRAIRLGGTPQMNFVNLIVHGLSAISVYSDVVGVRMILTSCFLIVTTLVAIGVTVAIRLVTDLAIPGWATNVFGFLLLVLLQAVLFCVVFSFVVLASRNQLTFMPLRDYQLFIKNVQRIWKQ